MIGIGGAHDGLDFRLRGYWSGGDSSHENECQQGGDKVRLHPSTIAPGVRRSTCWLSAANCTYSVPTVSQTEYLGSPSLELRICRGAFASRVHQEAETRRHRTLLYASHQ